jgi:hypothetical protein
MFLNMPNGEISKAIKIVGKPASGMHRPAGVNREGWSRKQVLELDEGFKKYPKVSDERKARAAGYKNKQSWHNALSQTKKAMGAPGRITRQPKVFGPQLNSRPNYTAYPKTGRPKRYDANRVDLR